MPGRRPAPETIATALRSFGLALGAECRSPHTINAYQRDLRTLERVLSERHRCRALLAVTPRLLDEALTAPEVMTAAAGSPRSRASLHRLKAAVKSFFAWAERTGRVQTNPARCVKLRRLPRRMPSFLTEAEAERLVSTLASARSATARRDRVIVELFLGTGIRLQELVGLDVEDVDLEAGHLRVRTKGDVGDVKFLSRRLRALLGPYVARRRRDGGPEPALFPSAFGGRVSGRQVARRLASWFAAAGLAKRLSPHSMRHSFASRLYRQTGDLLLVKRALGHRDVATTEIYTHLVDGALERALERM